jgi:hypothetical protein
LIGGPYPTVERRRRKTPHDDVKKGRKRLKTPLEYTKKTEQRSCQGMTTKENQSAPHKQNEGPRSWSKPHVAGTTLTYHLLDPGTPCKYAQKKECRSRQGTNMMKSQNIPYQ